MNVSSRKIVFSLSSLLIIAGVLSALAFASNRTFTGTVGDAMCGAKHLMPGGPAPCTKLCIIKGSKYALLAGDKVYVLDINDKAMLETVGERAGRKIAVTGTEKDNTITVNSVRVVQ